MTQPTYPYVGMTTRAERRNLRRSDVLGNGTAGDAAVIVGRVTLALILAAPLATAFTLAAIWALAPVMPS